MILLGNLSITIYTFTLYRRPPLPWAPPLLPLSSSSLSIPPFHGHFPGNVIILQLTQTIILSGIAHISVPTSQFYLRLPYACVLRILLGFTPVVRAYR